MKNNKHSSIKNWAEDDRPREKMLSKGADSLSMSELLAILIGSGSKDMSAVELCRKIMKDNENNLNLLSKRSVQELIKYKGIGEAKAVSIIAAMELVKRKKISNNDYIRITCSKEVFELMYPLIADLNHEEFWLILLNRKNRIIHKQNIGRGGVGNTTVDPKVIFKIAVNHLASGIILVHNHPSGQVEPSKPDIELTHKVKTAADLFDMLLLDHVILAGKNYYSFSDSKSL